MKAETDVQIKVIQAKHRQAKEDALFQMEEFVAITGLLECENCEEVFHEYTLHPKTGLCEGKLRCSKCPIIRHCETCFEQYEFGDQLNCECCSEQGCPNCIVCVDKDQYRGVCQICCADSPSICQGCADDRECVEKAACGLQVCEYCIDFHRSSCGDCFPTKHSFVDSDSDRSTDWFRYGMYRPYKYLF